MNTDVIKGKWKEIKGQLREQWGKFTESEIAKMKGNQEELEEMLQKKYGYEKEKANDEVDAFLKKKGYDGNKE